MILIVDKILETKNVEAESVMFAMEYPYGGVVGQYEFNIVRECRVFSYRFVLDTYIGHLFIDGVRTLFYQVVR